MRQVAGGYFVLALLAVVVCSASALKPIPKSFNGLYDCMHEVDDGATIIPTPHGHKVLLLRSNGTRSPRFNPLCVPIGGPCGWVIVYGGLLQIESNSITCYARAFRQTKPKERGRPRSNQAQGGI